jgi:hypothetical protein
MGMLANLLEDLALVFIVIAAGPAILLAKGVAWAAG